jgi:hypothetical protein
VTGTADRRNPGECAGYRRRIHRSMECTREGAYLVNLGPRSNRCRLDEKLKLHAESVRVTEYAESVRVTE